MPLNSSHIEDALSTTDEDVKVLLYSILNLNLQNSSSEKIIISTINKLLSTSRTRLQGLEFLNLVLCNCSKSLIIENAHTWISHCLVKYSNDDLKEIKLSTIGKIIENVHDDQEFSKKFIIDFISKVLASCISSPVNSHETDAALQTLTICMKYYPSWFTSHKEKIQSFVTSFFESSSENLVEKAGFAFLLLQQVGGAGTDGINHRNNFSTNFSKLCATVQKLFDKFFENEIEIDNTGRSHEEVFNFSDLSHYSQKMLHIMSRRITNCLKFLKIMLLKSFPTAKDIKPMEVLDIITRGTALHQCISMDIENSLDDCQFSLLLNRVQKQLLQLLRIFLLWLQENSLPFSFIISKVLIDCLKKIQSCHCFLTDSLYQEMVYKVLGCWLRMSKNSFHAHFQTQLVACILKDITPVKTNVTLSIQTNTKSKSPKAKRKFIQDRIISSGQGSTKETLTPAEIYNTEKNCLFALGTLKQLLCATTLKLKANILQDLYTTVINSILDIQTSRFNHPYTNNDCQAKLYEVLVAFYEQEALRVLPPLQLTIDVLNKGSSNENRHIAVTCEHGLSIVEKLCQPVCPSLFMPEMFLQEKYDNKHDSKQEAMFDKQIMDHLITQNLNGNEEAEAGILENIKNLNENLETNVVSGIKNDNNIEPEEIIENTNEDVELQEESNVDVQKENNEEAASSKTITKEKSIHIIDMKVLKTSTNELEPQEITEFTDVGDNPSKEIEANSLACGNNTATEINILKTEIRSIHSFNIDSVDDKPTSPAEESNFINEADKTDEPPSKKCRIEEEETFAEVEIKEEVKSSEEVDDVFEDGAFVDEIKEY